MKRRAAILIAALAGLGPSAGAEGPRFELPLLRLEWLETDLDRNSSKFEEYRDLDEGFRSGELRLAASSEDGERGLRLEARNLDRQDAYYGLSYFAPELAFDFELNRIPHRFGNDAPFLFDENSPGRFALPDALQAANQAALVARRGKGPIDYAFLSGLLAPALSGAGQIDVGLRRDRGRARLIFGDPGSPRVRFDYRDERRQGSRAYGASFGFGNVTELPEPIDYRTRDLEISTDWQLERGSVQFGVRASSFENAVSTMYWDNPFRSTDATDPSAYTGPSAGSVGGAATGFADLAPDNRATSFFGNARWQPGDRAWASLAVSYTGMRQNDALLPYTLNRAIVGIDFDGSRFDPTDPAKLPAQGAGREAAATNLNLAAGLRFGASWRLVGRYVLSDYDNSSRRLELPGYVRFHAVWEDIPRVTANYSFRRQDLSAELSRGLGGGSRLALAVKRREWDREFRETEETGENIVELSFDSKPASWLDLRASWEYGDRSIGGEYDTEAAEATFLDPAGSSNLPALRKYDQAARTYDDLQLQATFFFLDALELAVGGGRRSESYDESRFGLVADDLDQVSAELSYVPGEHLRFFVFGHRAERESYQRGRQSGATPSVNPSDDWDLTLFEKTATAGAGLAADLSKTWRLELQGNWSRSDGRADFATDPLGTPSVAFDIPNYEDIEMLSLSARLDWQLGESLAIGFSYLYEDFTMDRFLLQGLKPYLPGALLLAANEGSYRADVVAARVSLKL
jgi:MtrB/PioB family decaheme-associated outer membrane protein